MSRPRPPLFLNVGVLLALVVAVTGKGILFPGSPISESKDSCNLPSGATGTCKNINDCQVSAQNMDYQPPKFCGYEGEVAVVCCPQDACIDTGLKCASNAYQCNTNSYVQEKCKKTCNLCENGSKPDACIDIGLKCASNAYQCNTNSYVQRKCKKTCNLCENGSKPEPVRVTDISAPTINFECGVGYTSSYRDYDYDDDYDYDVYPLIPTPRPAQPSTSQSVPGFTDNFRRRRRGVSPLLSGLSPQQSFIPSCLYTPPRPEPSTAYLGGEMVTTYKYPWMALLGRDKAGVRIWFCGGVLINRRWVLTAAHCTNRFDVTVVRLGEHDFSRDDEGDHEDFYVAEIVIHGGYKPPQQYHDIALIRLAKPIKIRREMSPVCLPWGHEADLPLVGNTVTGSGWGSTRYFGDELSPFLNEADVTVLPTDMCASSYLKHAQDFTTAYPNSLGEETLCIGDISNQTLVKDACLGDSGGPAVLKRDGRYSVVGIVSAGFGCGKKEFPGLYVAVQYPQHLAWIKRLAFTPCESLCVNGNCNTTSNVCVCLDGWSGENCDKPICDHPCVQGDCLKPNSCSCYCAWYGDQCEHLWCDHGNYVDGQTCTCELGWSGKHCDIVNCTNGISYGPNGRSYCLCAEGWKGTHCDIADD